MRPYVRELQLSAYYNVPTAANVAELLRVANDMRQHGEMMSPRLRNEAFEQIFQFQLYDQGKFGKVVQAVSPDDVLATYDWLSTGRTDYDLAVRREFVGAFAIETAGRRAEALSIYQALQQKLRTSSLSSELCRAVDEAVKRLSAAKSS